MCARSRYECVYTRQAARCDGAFNQGVPSESSAVQPWNLARATPTKSTCSTLYAIIHGGVFVSIESDFLEKGKLIGRGGF